MKILSMKWRNYKGLADGEIAAEGRDVTISGQNGVGKSSIAEMLPFVLFGKTAGSLKRYDERGLTVRDKLIHGAEVTFDNGIRLKREVTDSTTGGTTTKLYVNGVPAQKRKFDATIEALTRGAGEMILNPFAFFNRSNKERRDFVARTFGAISNREILSTPENAGVAKMLDGLSVESFIARTKSELKSKQAQAKEICPRLEELERQLADVPQDLQARLKEVDAALKAKRLELSKTEVVTGNARRDYESARRRIGELERQESFITRQLQRERDNREKFLAQYKKLKSSQAGKCPTFGQTMPQVIFEAKRDEKIFEVVVEGKTVAKQITELELELSSIRTELEKIRQQARNFKVQAETESAAEKNRGERLAQLKGEIGELETQMMTLKAAMKVEGRIAQLKAEEREVNEEIAHLEGKLVRAEKYQHEKIQHFEEQINANFEYVRFKLFDSLVDGTPKEVCEAMIDGVPFSALSKGEKLKAALDIFRAIQRHYGVELPLILDDAESYTPNSLLDLPNQKFFFRVTEAAELLITIEEGRRAA